MEVEGQHTPRSPAAAAAAASDVSGREEPTISPAGSPARASGQAAAPGIAGGAGGVKKATAAGGAPTPSTGGWEVVGEFDYAVAVHKPVRFEAAGGAASSNHLALTLAARSCRLWQRLAEAARRPRLQLEDVLPLLARLGAKPGGGTPSSTSGSEYLALPAPVAAAFVRSFLVELSVCGHPRGGAGAGGLVGEDDDYSMEAEDWGVPPGEETKELKDEQQEEMAMLVMAVRAYAKKKLGVEL